MGLVASAGNGCPDYDPGRPRETHVGFRPTDVSRLPVGLAARRVRRCTPTKTRSPPSACSSRSWAWPWGLHHQPAEPAGARGARDAEPGASGGDREGPGRSPVRRQGTEEQDEPPALGPGDARDGDRHHSRYRGECRLATWFYRIALRRVSDFHRSPSRRHVPSGTPGGPGFPNVAASPDASPEGQACDTQRRERVRAALEDLADPARSVLLAYYVGEMTVAEVARALAMPEGTVKTHLHRGRRALRERLRDLC